MSLNAIASSQDAWALILQQQQLSNIGSTTSTSQTGESGNVNFADMLLSKLDTNGDGQISEEEAAAGVSDARNLLQSLNTQQTTMRQFESQGDLDTTAIREMFTQLDTNSDGVISAEEFSALQNLQNNGTTGQDTGLSSYFTKERMSIPGVMGAMGDLMTFTGHGQGNIPAYNMLMDQLLNR